MPITIADVAARAGVSKTTVSRVLNGKGELDAATAARVRKVIAELGYVPSARAVSLARGRTRIVGMLVPSLTWPWIGEVLQGVVDVVETEGYGLLLFTCNRGEESMRQFASQVSAKSFDGLLVIEPEGTLDYIAELHDGGLPVVLIDDRGHQPQFPSVATTNRDGGASAAEHLLAIGRSRPLVITGSQRSAAPRTARPVRRGVRRSRPTPRPEPRARGDFTFDCGREVRPAALETGVEFDAIFAHNDLSAAGAMQALREAGLRVPEDVAVVGFDDIPLAAHTEPPLTTVHQPMREMGETAARMLLAHFDGSPLPKPPTIIPTTLIVRGSTVPPDAAEPVPHVAAPAAQHRRLATSCVRPGGPAWPSRRDDAHPEPPVSTPQGRTHACQAPYFRGARRGAGSHGRGRLPAGMKARRRQRRHGPQRGHAERPADREPQPVPGSSSAASLGYRWMIYEPLVMWNPIKPAEPGKPWLATKWSGRPTSRSSSSPSGTTPSGPTASR